jgi:uncharacterized protein (TIGR01777 family)
MDNETMAFGADMAGKPAPAVLTGRVKRIAITGGSGMVGKRLTALLTAQGHDVVILSRMQRSQTHVPASQSVSQQHSRLGQVTFVRWLTSASQPAAELGDLDAIVNLAGVSINDGRWDAKHRRAIYDSRMRATDELLRILAILPYKPEVLVNASAVGIYPASQEATYTETSPARGTDVLARTVIDWEARAAQAEEWGVRTVYMRFGVVLDAAAGALPLMVLPYRLFAGGTIGEGTQWLSWVHGEDVARAIAFAIDNPALQGPVNVVAPEAQQMRDFGKTIGRVLHRPHWIPAPAPLMRLALGRKSALVLEGQHVLPSALENAGFNFSFPTAEAALTDLLK